MLDLLPPTGRGQHADEKERAEHPRQEPLMRLLLADERVIGLPYGVLRRRNESAMLRLARRSCSSSKGRCPKLGNIRSILQTRHSGLLVLPALATGQRYERARRAVSGLIVPRSLPSLPHAANYCQTG